MRGRGQGVGWAVPDVATAIAVEVHGVGVVGGRDELGLPHRTGPGAEHLLGLDIAVLEDLQGGQQLAVGKGRAATFVGQGREERMTDLLPWNSPKLLSMPQTATRA